MNDFLPDKYEVPASSGRYMKLQQGENRFRILGSPILGNEYWTEQNGKKSPVRKRMGEKIVTADLEESDGRAIKHFWAMPVWSYRDNSVQILEITQKGLQKAVKELASDEDWGNPRDYDLSVLRQGEGMETEYSVVPKPKKKLEEAALNAWKETQADGFNLEALFGGGDPFTFGTEAPITIEEVDALIAASDENNQ